jgi:hypothetical protein
VLGLWVRIPLRTCLSCDQCVLSGSGVCDGPIPRSEELY